MPKVSVITPTYQRDEYLRNLVRYFEDRTFADAELIILDDSPQPSSFFSSEAARQGIRYYHTPHRVTLGEKRNALLDLAAGEIIMQFDDDDYYSPHYIERMLELLDKDDFLTLSGWFAHSRRENAFGYWATDVIHPSGHFVLSPETPGIGRIAAEHFTEQVVERNLWGYGFSYVFRKSVTDRVRFDPINHGEDFAFARKLGEAGFRMATVPDVEGLVLHVMHPTNTSLMFPQYLLPDFLVEAFFPGYANEHSP